MLERQDVYHHYDDKPKVNMKVERNSRGYNWEVTVTGSVSVDEALTIVQDAKKKLSQIYTTQEKGETK